MTLRTFLRIVASVLLLAVAGWYVLQSADLDRTWTMLSQANGWLLAASVPVILASHLARAIRWQFLLDDGGTTVSRWEAFRAVMIGYAANTVVPRSGEVLRPWILSRRTSVPMGRALGTVVVERVLDVLTLLAGIAAITIVEQERLLLVFPDVPLGSAVVSVVLPVVVLIAVLVAVVATPLGRHLIDAVFGRRRPALARTMVSTLETIRAGLASIGRRRTAVRVAMWTVVLWVLYILPIQLIHQAMDLQPSIGFGDAGLLLVIISIGVTIAPTPGALGVYQTFAQTSLVVLFSAAPSDGLAFGILAWLLNYGLAIVVGSVCLVPILGKGITLRDVGKASSAP